jgi:hypothetical protein
MVKLHFCTVGSSLLFSKHLTKESSSATVACTTESSRHGTYCGTSGSSITSVHTRQNGSHNRTLDGTSSSTTSGSTNDTRTLWLWSWFGGWRGCRSRWRSSKGSFNTLQFCQFIFQSIILCLQLRLLGGSARILHDRGGWFLNFLGKFQFALHFFGWNMEGKGNVRL